MYHPLESFFVNINNIMKTLFYRYYKLFPQKNALNLISSSKSSNKSESKNCLDDVILELLDNVFISMSCSLHNSIRWASACYAYIIRLFFQFIAI